MEESAHDDGMEWKRPLTSAAFAAGTASMFLLGENTLFPPGDIGWLYIAVACFVFVAWLHRDELLGWKRPTTEDDTVPVSPALMPELRPEPPPPKVVSEVPSNSTVRQAVGRALGIRDATEAHMRGTVVVLEGEVEDINQDYIILLARGTAEFIQLPSDETTTRAFRRGDNIRVKGIVRGLNEFSGRDYVTIRPCSITAPGEGDE